MMIPIIIYIYIYIYTNYNYKFTFKRPTKKITNYLTWVSGITHDKIKDAPRFYEIKD